eukprot:6246737-Pyramimonas_sp.AAC.1
MHAEALDLLSAGISREQLSIQESQSREWRRRFASWSKNIYKLATPLFRAASPTAPADVVEMQEEWEQ